ncbi:unnamed protein product, partial [Brachionus calyciflorus]
IHSAQEEKKNFEIINASQLAEKINKSAEETNCSLKIDPLLEEIKQLTDQK